MDINLKQFEEHCVKYYIYDSYQYAEGIFENINTAKYCLDLINQLIAYRNYAHLQFQEKCNQSLIMQLESKKTASISISADNLPSDKFDILGVTVSYAWLLEKYIKDYFQYIRNSYDAIAQVISSALIVGDGELNNEWPDFDRIKSKISQRYQEEFPLTESLLTQIDCSGEYTYIRDYNNRTKHIKSVKTKISNELFGEGSTYKLLAFEKKESHSDKDIQIFIGEIFDFTNKFIEDIFQAIIAESKQMNYAIQRIHDLKYYSQIGDNDSHLSYTNIFINVDTEFSELPDEIEVLAIRSTENIINASNVNIATLLVCTDEGKNPSSCVGQYNLKSKVKNDGLYHYYRYSKDKEQTNNILSYMHIMDSGLHFVLNKAFVGTTIFCNESPNNAELDEGTAKKIEEPKQSADSENAIATITLEKPDGEPLAK